jgi:P-type conjugative transfer ATPase TrbB
MLPTSVRSPEQQAQARRLASLRSAMLPIVPFLDDDRVIEVMLNADGAVWVERVGEGLVETDVVMDAGAALRMLRLVAAELGCELTEASPSLGGKLPHWGSRVQAAIPPIVEGPVFALRKPSRVVFGLEDYVRAKILTPEQATVLADAVRSRENVLVGGGTGSGKTTLANALLREIASSGDRVFIVEDTPELQCTVRNRIQVLVSPPRYTFERAIVDAMRFRPDRIVVGEVRDGAALELLKGWNTGHPGGLGTLHANSTRAMLDRLCQLIGEVAVHVPRALVAQAVNVCVHMERDTANPAGRRVTGIDRVIGFSDSEWHLEPMTKPNSVHGERSA